MEATAKGVDSCCCNYNGICSWLRRQARKRAEAAYQARKCMEAAYVSEKLAHERMEARESAKGAVKARRARGTECHNWPRKP